LRLFHADDIVKDREIVDDVNGPPSIVVDISAREQRKEGAGGPRQTKAADTVSQYVNRASSGHKWNEHEYYVKARTDMQKHHRDKITKVRREI